MQRLTVMMCPFWLIKHETYQHVMYQQRETHQQRDDKLVQVNHLDAAHIQLHYAVSFRGVCVTGTLCGCGSQTHGKAEHLITHNGNGLKSRKTGASHKIKEHHCKFIK